MLAFSMPLVCAEDENAKLISQQDKIEVQRDQVKDKIKKLKLLEKIEKE